MLSELSSDYEFEVVAVAQEQHAERTRLYKQWKQLDWLILQDSFCEMELPAVPSLIPIDEKGMVLAHRANKETLIRWLKGKSEIEPLPAKSTIMQNEEVKLLTAEADRMVKFPDDEKDLDKAISRYSKASKIDDTNALLQFRLGVAYRMRFDRDNDATDFEKAAKAWTTALELKPNQYIFRRRIEQYGPRLIKPYPFYDWVDSAISEISERGEKPVELSVKLSGAEIAQPLKHFSIKEAAKQTNPDPDAKINHDELLLINVKPIVVPFKIEPGKAGRVHLVLSPGGQVKWNNESEATKVWLSKTDGIEFSHQLLESKLPSIEISYEPRVFEFEVKLTKDYKPGQALKGFALFGVCTDDDGVCRYLRRDFEIHFGD